MVHLELPDNWHDLAAGYVLNNLSEEEAWVWNMLLQEYPELHQEIQRLDQAFNGLADAVPLYQPSPTLLQNIHATLEPQQILQAQTFQQRSSEPSHMPSNPPGHRQSSPQSISKGLIRHPGPRGARQPLFQTFLSSERYSVWSRVRSLGRGNRTVQIGAVIAAGIVAVLGVQIQHLQTQLQHTDTELQQANIQIKSLNRQLRQAEMLTQSTRPMVQTLQQPESLIYRLAGSNLAKTAFGRLVLSDQQHVVIVVQNLPLLPEGKVYRLWAALQTKDVVYCGQFNSNVEGVIQLTPSSDHCGENPSQMIITLDTVTDPTTQGGPIVMQSSI